MDKIIAGGVLGLAILLLIAVIYAIGGFIFAMAWNLVMPLIWHGAPHLSWMAGIAAAWLIGILQSIFGSIGVVRK